MVKTESDEAVMVAGNVPGEEIPGAPNGQKKKKNNTKVNPNDLVKDIKERTMEKQIRSISISPKGKVTVKIDVVITHPLQPGQEDNDQTIRKLQVQSPDEPHSDFTNALKALRKPALELVEVEVERDRLNTYTVSGITIAGDMALHQSRVELTIAHQVKRTGKVVELETGEVTMYGESDYPGMESMTKQIEKVIDEAWEYINGKFATSNQLPLFSFK